ncbi:MAG: methylmalonyl-CoA epimerase [Rubricoccaceae bacterium]
MTLDHLGIAATAASRDLFEQLLASSPYTSEVVETQGVRTVFFGDGGRAGEAPKLELLESTRDDSPIARFLASKGPGLHHIAFEVRDLEHEMDRVRQLGIRLLSDTPLPGADGKQIVFLHPKDTAGVLVELCQSTRAPREQLAIPGPNGELAAYLSGPSDAPPLVVLHAALGSTTLETDRLIAHWEKAFRVIALDFSGHGASASSNETPTWDTYTNDVTALIEHLDLRDIRLFGFSMGGGVALAAAARHSDRVARVAAHATNVQWDNEDVDRMAPPMLAALDNPDGRWATRLAETHGPSWRDLVHQLVGFTRGLPNTWISDDVLASIRQPALVSAGDTDRYFDVRHAVHLYKTLPNAHLWILPGLDHPIQGVDVPTFAAAIASHLAPNA